MDERAPAGPSRRGRALRFAGVGVGLAGVVALAIMGGIIWRASGIIERLAHDWAADAVARESRGAYRLELGRVRLDWLLRRVTVDSILLTTNAAANARRGRPLADLHIALDRCTLAGVRLTALARGQGLLASAFGCRIGRITVVGPRPTGTTGRGPFLVFTPALRLPPRTPRVSIGRVTFPNLTLHVRMPHERRGETQLDLDRLRGTLRDFLIDPADSAAQVRPLFSKHVELVADSFLVHPDSVTAVAIGRIKANLTDSTLDLSDLRFAPSGSDAAYLQFHPYRRDVPKVTAAHATASGVDFGAFGLGWGAVARRVELDSLRVEVLSDKRRPKNPHPPARRTPQQWIADLNESIIVDSLLVHDGEVKYRERRPERDHSGVVSFTGIDATATHLRHLDGRSSRRDSMTLALTAWLQKTGRFDLRINTPLDGPGFDIAVNGTLGAMPATAFNTFLEEVYPWKIDQGAVKSVSLTASVRNGVASGAITPLYNDVSLTVTGRGAGGILGAKGIVGGAARGIASMAANLTRIKGDNPDDASRAPRRGQIRRSFNQHETLPAFLWAAVRDALLPVIQK